ncbi:hypothetical protein FD754_011217 [Muntiacus muntjak]|uniref:Uncharacterized protein n=1 Tax=Muntiacus muntjak TaxID=9888 RepID=A0A5N3VAY0_MUNMU|nr:hypothetical protein FD754_011217 [Muntiacus muntjak]
MAQGWDCNPCTKFKNFFEGPLGEENVILTLYPVNEEIVEDHQVEPGVSSTSEVKEELEEACPSSSFRRSVCPLPTTLPPINDVSRDTVKIEVYRRLQEHAYPEKDQYIPKSSQEAQMHSCSRKYNMVTKRGSTQKRKMSEREEKTTMVEVVTSARVARLAAWSRTAARAVQPKAVNSCALLTSQSFLPQASGIRCFVVHGTPLLADTEGWVHLRFQAGQTWVPNTPRMMTSLFMNEKIMKRLIAMGRRKKPGLDTPSSLLLNGPCLKTE